MIRMNDNMADGRYLDDIGDGSRNTDVVCKEGERQRSDDDGRVEQFNAAGHGVPSFLNR